MLRPLRQNLNEILAAYATSLRTLKSLVMPYKTETFRNLPNYYALLNANNLEIINYVYAYY
jgi:hypothetical protein